MRLGSLVMGFLLAIGLAYAHDLSVSGASPDGHPQTLVNWEVFRAIADGAGTWLRTQTDTLLDLLHHRG